MPLSTCIIDYDPAMPISCLLISPSYDGDVLVREVDADYVVWEVHGRTDFQYTAIASQVSLV